MLMFYYADCERLNMLVVHRNEQGMPWYVLSVRHVCCGHNCVCD